MVKVYFEIHRGSTVVPDPEGEEFANLADARKEAEASLYDMLANDITSGEPLEPRRIAILDEGRNTLASIELVADVKVKHEP